MVKASSKYLTLLLALALPAYAVGEPRGYRNYNPGNLVATHIPWKGKIACTNGERVHECFVDDYHGIRAMLITLRTYIQEYELTTVDAIMHRFSEFDGAAAAVARIGQLGLHEELDITNSVMMVSLVQAIIIQENGHTRYSNAYIQEVLYDTYGAMDLSRQHSAGSRVEDMGDEAASGEGEAQLNDAGAGCPDRRAAGDTRYQEQRVPVDSPPNSSIYSRSSDYSAKGSSHPVPVPANNSWLDGVKRGILAVQRSVGVAHVARCSRTGDYPDGHALSVGYCWTLFWW